MKALPLILILPLLFLVACTSAPTPQIVTEIVTVQVEIPVTIEVPVVTEVVRDVIVTQIVEVPVTMTPTPTLTAEVSPTVFSPAEVTATWMPAVPGAAATYFPPAPTAPDDKVAGYAPLFVRNMTDGRIEVFVSGPYAYVFQLSSRDSQMQKVVEANYTYQVLIDGRVVYSDQIPISNPDKFELIVYNNRVVFKMP